MFAFTLSLFLLFASAVPAAVQCRPSTSSSFTAITTTIPSSLSVTDEGQHLTHHRHHHHHQSRPSLRELFFSGLFLLRPSVADTPSDTLDAVNAVPEIDTNELPPLADRFTGIESSSSSSSSPPPTLLPLAQSPVALAALAAPPPPLSSSLYARFSALSDRLSLEKAILPSAMPVQAQVDSDRVVKKIDYIAPRMMDSIPQLVMTE